MGGGLFCPPIQYRVRPDPVQNRVKFTSSTKVIKPSAILKSLSPPSSANKAVYKQSKPFLTGPLHANSQKLTIVSLGVKLKTSSNRRVSAIIRLCVLMQKPPRQTLIRGNSLLNLLKDISAFRLTILIRITSMRSTNL